MYIKLSISILLLSIIHIFCNESSRVAAGDEVCRDVISREDIENHLSTKTPYRAVANFNDKPPIQAEGKQTYVVIEFHVIFSSSRPSISIGCRPSRLWAIIRHGTRNPSKKVIKQAKSKLTALKDEILTKNGAGLCPQYLERLSMWKFNVTPDEEKFLVAEGEDELIELAERMQNRFPTLLRDVYDPKMFYFKYTATQRTLKSAQSFATGLFGRHRIGDIIYPEPLHKDPVLRVSTNRF